MAIFDTSKIYFSITDWRDQRTTLFRNATILPWDDDIKFYSDINQDAKMGDYYTMGFVENSLPLTNTINYKWTIGRKQYNQFNQEEFERFIKTKVSALVGQTVTEAILSNIRLKLSTDTNKVFDTVEDAIIGLEPEFRRKDTLDIVLPFNTAKVDENGLYKGYNVIYTPYMKPNNTGLVLDTSKIWVAAYPDNYVKMLEEESAVTGEIKFIARYQFKFGLTTTDATNLFTIA